MAQIILIDDISEQQAFDEHHPGFFEDRPEDLVEPFYSGDEYGLNYGYYAGDDEVLDQDVFDEVAYACWRDEIDLDD